MGFPTTKPIVGGVTQASKLAAARTEETDTITDTDTGVHNLPLLWMAGSQKPYGWAVLLGRLQ